MRIPLEMSNYRMIGASPRGPVAGPEETLANRRVGRRIDNVAKAVPIPLSERSGLDTSTGHITVTRGGECSNADCQEAASSPRTVVGGGGSFGPPP